MQLRTWWIPSSVQLYKWMPADANYSADSPWSSMGRFGDGRHKTLYLAESPAAAVAEFLRRHPEFMDLQSSLAISIYEIDINVEGECLDVRTDENADACGVGRARLTSSDEDENVRYVECRLLAEAVITCGGVGIAYPSAAALWGQWNLVLFGDPERGRWLSVGVSSVARPVVSRDDVAALTWLEVAT